MELIDLPFIMEIERLSFTHPWSENSFVGEIENHHISFPYVILYEPQNRIIGYVIFWILGEEAQISNFAVHPDFRGHGLGEDTLVRILRMLRNFKCSMVLLEVRPSNMAARRLYNKYGFRVLGIRKNYYQSPVEDALVMVKYLNREQPED